MRIYRFLFLSLIILVVGSCGGNKQKYPDTKYYARAQVLAGTQSIGDNAPVKVDTTGSVFLELFNNDTLIAFTLKSLGKPHEKNDVAACRTFLFAEKYAHTNMFKISFYCNDSKFAVKFTDTLLKYTLVAEERARILPYKRKRAFINQQLDTLEAMLDNLQEGYKINEPDFYYMLSTEESKMVKLKIEQEILEKTRDALVNKNLRAESISPVVFTGIDPFLEQNFDALIHNMNERDQLLKLYPQNDKKVKDVLATINGLKKKMLVYTENSLKSVKINIREQEIKFTRFSCQAPASVDQIARELTREQINLLEKQYAYFLEKKTGLEITMAGILPGLRIVQSAVVYSTKTNNRVFF